MNIVDKARAIESRIARALSQVAESAVGGDGSRQPLELVHAIVEAVERQIQSGGRGARLFPFDSIDVAVLAPSRDARAQVQAVFAAAPSLRDRIVAKLHSAGCDVADLDVNVTYTGRSGRQWIHPQFHVTFERIRAADAAPANVAPMHVEVTVLRGTTEPPSYATAAVRIDLGRGIEVRDDRNRLLRTNHVAFTEGATAENQTVSRKHAHIAFDPQSGTHRLHDDGSVHGTGIVRGGRTIPVPPGARGVRLRSGDEIVLGEARVRVRIGTEPRNLL